MIPQALEVVEAVRKLSPRRMAGVDGKWQLGCEPRHINQRVRDLGEALEAFDAAAGAQNAPLIPVLQAIHAAVQKGVSMDEIALAIGEMGDDETIDANAVNDLKPQPGEIGPPDKVSDSSPVPAPAPSFGSDGPQLADKYMAPEPAPLSAALRPVSQTASRKLTLTPYMETATGMQLKRYVDEVDVDFDVALADAGDYSADADMEMDAIGDRLSAVLGRHGLTPKLRILLVAFVQARNKAAVDMNGPVPKLGANEAGVMARVNAELALLEANPALAYDGDPENNFNAPMPSLRAVPHR